MGGKKIKYYGNLKFAQVKSDPINEYESDFLAKLKSRKIWCAASTHKSEELLCAKTHLNLKTKYKNVLTIIIPRHVNRTKTIFE